LKWLSKRNGNKNYLRFLKQIFEDTPEGSVIFIDSIQNFVDVNDQNQTTLFMKTLRHYVNLKKFTIFAIHHLAKTTGKSKGHTQIEDMADSVYYVQPIKDNSLVKGWTLTVSKQRYKTDTELTIKFLKDFSFDISNVAIDKSVFSILSYITYLILKSKENLTQSALIKKVKEKFNVGNNKLYNILKEYKEKGLFIEKTGLYNTKYYDINFDSPFFSVVANLSEVQRALIEKLNEIDEDELPRVIEVRDSSRGILEYKTKTSIKRDIMNISDKEAKLIMNQIDEMNDSSFWDELNKSAEFIEKEFLE
jgi:hypothetical protein